MSRIGFTGHQAMPELARAYVRRGIAELLSQIRGPLIGISSLAAGADQIFASEILNRHGQLWVVIPSTDYQSTLHDDDLAAYRSFLEGATDVIRLDFDRPSEAAYDAAGKWIVENCDELVAVWDGKPARGLGGTGDVVAYAKEFGRNVRVLWPPGIVRSLAKTGNSHSRRRRKHRMLGLRLPARLAVGLRGKERLGRRYKKCCHGRSAPLIKENQRIGSRIEPVESALYSFEEPFDYPAFPRGCWGDS